MKEKVKTGDTVYYAGNMKVHAYVVGELGRHGAFWTQTDDCGNSTLVTPYMDRWFKSRSRAWECIRDQFIADTDIILKKLNANIKKAHGK